MLGRSSSCVHSFCKALTSRQVLAATRYNSSTHLGSACASCRGQEPRGRQAPCAWRSRSCLRSLRDLGRLLALAGKATTAERTWAQLAQGAAARNPEGRQHPAPGDPAAAHEASAGPSRPVGPTSAPALCSPTPPLKTSRPATAALLLQGQLVLAADCRVHCKLPSNISCAAPGSTDASAHLVATVVERDVWQRRGLHTHCNS